MKNADIDFSDLKIYKNATQHTHSETDRRVEPAAGPAVPGAHTVRDAGTHTLATAYSESGEFGGTTEP